MAPSSSSSNLKPPESRSRTLERSVWLGLAVVVAAIVGMFWRQTLAGPSLPVISVVPPFALTNQFEQTVSRDTLSNQIWIADIIFTRCPMQCLKMSNRMRQLQTELAGDDTVRLVSLTADPEYDTPAVLKKYGEKFGARPDRWWFLTGPRKSINELASDGLKMSVQENPAESRAVPEDLFIHSTYFVLVDRQGRMRAVFDGDEEEWKSNLQKAVKKLLREAKK